MYNKIKGLVEKGENLFITGGAGTGKSYTLNRLSEDFPEMIITATTGMAAVNVNGETIHKWSGARLFQDPADKVKAVIRKIPEKLDSIINCERLAIDEISMLASYQLDYLDGLFKLVRGNNKPFGGIQLLLFGDLFQLPPIKIHETIMVDGKKEKIDYCFKAKCWKSLKLKIINLTKVYRQKDKNFVDVLNSIREGKPKNLDLLYARNNVTCPIDATRVYAVNSKVETWNKSQYNKIDNTESIYWAKDIFYKGKKEVNPWDKDSKLTDKQKKVFKDFDEKQCKAVRCLKLKVGTRVMLLHNLDTSLGLCNGSCGYVISLGSNFVKVKFDNGEEKDIYRNIFQLKSNGKVMIERKQIPLMYAWGNTIHKFQGATIEKCAIDFDKIFEKGQCYVALSRATKLDTLYLSNFSEDRIFVDPEIVNFYKKLK